VAHLRQGKSDQCPAPARRQLPIDGFDAAEVDADGRIAALLTFGGESPAPLPQGYV
jgi:hypothetical protein